MNDVKITIHPAKPLHDDVPLRRAAEAVLMACKRCGATMLRGTQCKRCGAWCR